MTTIDDDINAIRSRFEKLAWTLDERLLAAAEASVVGHSGVTRVAQATGVSRHAIHVGLEELATAKVPGENQRQRIRKVGAGGKSVTETHSGLMVSLEKLVEPTQAAIPNRRGAGPARVCARWRVN